MTEDEAKTKWCPTDRPTGSHNHDRLIALEDSHAELLEFAENYIGQFYGHQITNTSSAKHDAIGWLRDLAREASQKAKQIRKEAGL